MKGLLHILIFAGVVLFGYNNSSAMADEKDKKSIKQDISSGTKRDKSDTLIKVDKQVDDTLVYDDYDEDDNGIIIKKELTTGKASYILCTITPTSNEIAALKVNSGLNSASDAGKTNRESTAVIPSPTFSLFPNPANAAEVHTLKIHHNFEGDVMVYLIDATGKTVVSQNFSSRQIELNTPIAGVYFVSIIQGNQKITSRLIVR